MKARLLRYLVCPRCQDRLELSVQSVRSGPDNIVDGSLQCWPCRRVYPITGGVPRMVPYELSPEVGSTAARFGWEWRHFVELHDAHRAQFLDWISPLQPSFFEGKVVLDGGCGIGRHALYAAEFGARDVIAMDLSDAVETAQRNVGHLPNVHVVQGDLFCPPLRHGSGQGDLDFAYCIGVLHHLEDPQGGFESLVQLLKPGGTVFAWVYGYENNAIVHRLIDPIRRRLTRRLSPHVLLGLSWLLTVLLQLVVHGVYHPLRSTALFQHLPSHAYFGSLARFSFRHKHAIVFDHLTAPTAFYIKRIDFESWFRKLGLCDVEISWRNENSWRGRARRPDREPMAEAAPALQWSAS
jgi:SAM-dependent methyltransferase